MKRFLLVALVGVFALGMTGTVYANWCALDAVPASTLLFPFVTYDYEQGEIDNSGQTTLFAITNVSSEAQIVHITIWSDYSVAVLDFNLTLTGYDVQTINIRDILRDGMLPSDVNGDANIWEEDNEGGTPFDDGPFSTFNELWDSNLDGWFSLVGLPDPQPTADDDTLGLSAILNCDPDEWDSSPNNYFDIPSGTLSIFRNYFQASQTADTLYGLCEQLPLGDPALVELDVLGNVDTVISFDDVWFTEQYDRPTWMYITADVVGACNKDLPDGAPGYFVDPFGPVPPGQTYTDGVQVANVLIGDVIYLDEGNNYAEADNAVHLEASPFMFSVPDDDGNPTTFYDRYHGGFVAGGFMDYREPLPTAWGFRYMNGPHLSGETTAPMTWIRAWKGGTNSAIVEDLNNASLSLGPDEIFANTCTPYTYYAWDEDENVNRVEGSIVPWSGGPLDEPIPVPNLFPLETQEVDAGQLFLVGDPDELRFGWLMFIWPRSNTTSGPVVGVDLDQYQTWMGVKYAPFGQYTAGLSGAVLGNYNCNPTAQLPILQIGSNSFGFSE